MFTKSFTCKFIFVGLTCTVTVTSFALCPGGVKHAFIVAFGAASQATPLRVRTPYSSLNVFHVAHSIVSKLQVELVPDDVEHLTLRHRRCFLMFNCSTGPCGFFWSSWRVRGPFFRGCHPPRLQPSFVTLKRQELWIPIAKVAQNLLTDPILE